MSKSQVFILFFAAIIVGLTQTADAKQYVPEWVNDILLWYEQGHISQDVLETTMQYLIENQIIIIHQTQDCSGNAKCITGVVTKVIDGDTIEVNGKSVRFALASAPEMYETDGIKAKALIEALCPVGSAVLVDEDDKQTKGSYGRTIGVIYCNGMNLNEELVKHGLGYLTSGHCKKSEFSHQKWAQENGCHSPEPYTTKETTPKPESAPKAEPAPKEPEPTANEKCDLSYPTVCIPPYPPDLDCGEIEFRNFTVLQPDPHKFDGDKDGIGCES